MAEYAGKTRVVFVGNLPYDATEQEVQRVFEVAGPVVSFRHVIDRDSNKAKGFGFCEYYDTETAASAVRNLNGVAEVRGRPLRVDFAQPDIKDLPRDQRGARDKHGLPPLPPGVILPPGENPAERIHKVLQNVAPAQLLDVMHQLKGLVIRQPDQARTLLEQNPQLCYAIFQGMLMMNIVDPSVLQRMVVPGSAGSQNPIQPMHPGLAQGPGFGPNPPLQQQPYGQNFGPGGMSQPPPASGPYQQQGYQQGGFAPGPPPQGGNFRQPAAPQSYNGPPPNAYGNQMQQPAPSMAQPQPVYGMPPPQQQAGYGTPNPVQQGQQPPVANAQQQALLQQVLSMSQQQIDMLPPDQKQTVLAIRQSAGRM